MKSPKNTYLRVNDPLKAPIKLITINYKARFRFKFRCFTQYCLCNGKGNTALGLFILFLLLTNYSILLFSSLVELSPNILLYRHIYLQVFSPLIQRDTNCSLALLTSICYISSSTSSSPSTTPLFPPVTSPHPQTISNFHCSHPLPPGISSTSKFLLYSDC